MQIEIVKLDHICKVDLIYLDFDSLNFGNYVYYFTVIFYTVKTKLPRFSSPFISVEEYLLKFFWLSK